MTFFEDAAAANQASIDQLRAERKAARQRRKERAKMSKHGTAPTGAPPHSPSGKAWKDMTEAEQKADIQRRLGNMEARNPSGSAVYTPASTYKKKDCVHYGDQDVLSLFGGTIKVAGARNFSLDDPPNDTLLVVDLNGQVKFNIKPWIIEAPECMAALIEPPRKAPDLIRLNWPDGGVPMRGPAWWATFLTTLQKAYVGQKGRVIFSCTGSHGRTGTALAALYLTGDPKVSVREAIELVRERHCEDCVETAAQVRYLRHFRPNEKDTWFDTCHAYYKTPTTQAGFLPTGGSRVGQYWENDDTLGVARGYVSGTHVKP